MTLPPKNTFFLGRNHIWLTPHNTELVLKLITHKSGFTMEYGMPMSMSQCQSYSFSYFFFISFEVHNIPKT